MRVLLVCTGNTCRSVIASSLLREILTAHGIRGIDVASAGTHASAGTSANPGALRAAAAVGLDLSGHRARSFDPTVLKPGDLVLTMEQRQRQVILEMGVPDPGAVLLLGQFGAQGQDIPDPIGGADSAYESCLQQLERCLKSFVTWLEDERIARA